MWILLDSGLTPAVQESVVDRARAWAPGDAAEDDDRCAFTALAPQDRAITDSLEIAAAAICNDGTRTTSGRMARGETESPLYADASVLCAEGVAKLIARFRGSSATSCWRSRVS